MPSEIRRIIFSDDEVRSALKGTPLSASFPRELIISKKLKGTFEKYVEVEFRQDGKLQSGRLRAGELTEALIAYCIALRIMLPRQAEKTVGIEKGSVTLDLTFESSAGEASPDESSLGKTSVG